MTCETGGLPAGRPRFPLDRHRPEFRRLVIYAIRRWPDVSCGGEAVRQRHRGSGVGRHLRSGSALWSQRTYGGRMVQGPRNEDHRLYSEDGGAGADVQTLRCRDRQHRWDSGSDPEVGITVLYGNPDETL